MKCLFCETEMAPGAVTDGLFVCPRCDTHVYMRERNLIPGMKSPKYLVDSFNYMKFLHDAKPDVVLSQEPIFSMGFNTTTTLAVFDSRRNTSMYKNSLYPVTSFVNSILIGDYGVLSFRQILNYKFSVLLSASMASIDECHRVPYMTLDMCTPERYLWQLFVSANIPLEKRLLAYTAVQHLCATSVAEYATHKAKKSEDAIAVFAGTFKDTRWARIAKDKNTYWVDAVENYFKECARRLAAGVTAEDLQNAYARRRAALDAKNGKNTLLAEIIRNYHDSSPALRDVVDKDSMFDVEYPSGIDSTILDLLESKSSGVVMFNQLNRYKLYAQIFDSLNVNRPPVAKDLPTAYNIVKEWCNT